MADYFKNIRSKEQAKKIYKEFAKKLHPDAGGNNQDFQNLTEQYQNFLKNFNQVKQKVKNKKIIISENDKDKIIDNISNLIQIITKVSLENIIK